MFTASIASAALFLLRVHGWRIAIDDRFSLRTCDKNGIGGRALAVEGRALAGEGRALALGRYRKNHTGDPQVPGSSHDRRAKSTLAYGDSIR
jgi:hypothetical protein